MTVSEAGDFSQITGAESWASGILETLELERLEGTEGASLCPHLEFFRIFYSSRCSPPFPTLPHTRPPPPTLPPSSFSSAGKDRLENFHLTSP